MEQENYNMKNHVINGRVPVVPIKSKWYFVTSEVIPKGTDLAELS